MFNNILKTFQIVLEETVLRKKSEDELLLEFFGYRQSPIRSASEAYCRIVDRLNEKKES